MLCKCAYPQCGGSACRAVVVSTVDFSSLVLVDISLAAVGSLYVCSILVFGHLQFCIKHFFLGGRGLFVTSTRFWVRNVISSFPSSSLLLFDLRAIVRVVAPQWTSPAPHPPPERILYLAWTQIAEAKRLLAAQSANHLAEGGSGLWGQQKVWRRWPAVSTPASPLVVAVPPLCCLATSHLRLARGPWVSGVPSAKPGFDCRTRPGEVFPAGVKSSPATHCIKRDPICMAVLQDPAGTLPRTWCSPMLSLDHHTSL